MKTGYFAKHGNMQGAISIARKDLPFFSGPAYKILAPTWPMLKMERKEYDRAYLSVLKGLNARKVYDDLCRLAGDAEPILICFERSNRHCHRRLVAEWLELMLHVEISEFGLPREEVIAYKNLV